MHRRLQLGEQYFPLRYLFVSTYTEYNLFQLGLLLQWSCHGVYRGPIIISGISRYLGRGWGVGVGVGVGGIAMLQAVPSRPGVMFP